MFLFFPVKRGGVGGVQLGSVPTSVIYRSWKQRNTHFGWVDSPLTLPQLDFQTVLRYFNSQLCSAKCVKSKFVASSRVNGLSRRCVKIHLRPQSNSESDTTHILLHFISRIKALVPPASTKPPLLPKFPSSSPHV